MRWRWLVCWLSFHFLRGANEPGQLATFYTIVRRVPVRRRIRGRVLAGVCLCALQSNNGHGDRERRQRVNVDVGSLDCNCRCRLVSLQEGNLK